MSGPAAHRDRSVGRAAAAARSIRSSRSCTAAGGGLPTDSIYALGCAIESREAIERIYRAKGMKPEPAPGADLPGHVDGFGVRTVLADGVPARAADLPRAVHAGGARRPGRCRARSRTPSGARSGSEITSHPIAQAIARALGRPLLTSSATVPDTHEPCRDAEEILEAFEKHIDVVIDSEQTPAEPSTVIEVDGEADLADPSRAFGAARAVPSTSRPRRRSRRPSRMAACAARAGGDGQRPRPRGGLRPVGFSGGRRRIAVRQVQLLEQLRIDQRGHGRAPPAAPPWRRPAP